MNNEAEINVEIPEITAMFVGTKENTDLLRSLTIFQMLRKSEY